MMSLIVYQLYTILLYRSIQYATCYAQALRHVIAAVI
jgi:hypothetical protein